MISNKKIIISLSIIGLLLVSLAISYAYFSAKITNNESESTIVATAAYLELTFIDGSPEINASNILPGWSASKTFSVQNTGENTAYYVLKITDINNPFVYGGISYKIESEDGGANVALDTLPLANMPVSGPIEIPVNTTHNYTITTYYNELEESQLQDLGKSFSYTVSIEAVYKKEIQYIEDLVDLSNEVSRGNKYEHTWFVLTRDLDFNSDENYKNPTNTTTYGDYNGNGTVESIKTELTTGRGFKPIGNISSDFRGSFDGQNNRIDNLHVYNNTSSSQIRTGLFGRSNGSVFSNIIVSGVITSTYKESTVGLFASCTGNTVINNAINEADIVSQSNGWSVGGIVGAFSGNIYLKNSVNNGTILNGNYTGGLIGSNEGSLIIENSHNEGYITNNKGRYIGGLLAYVRESSNITKIYNSYNTGKVTTSVSGTNDTYTGGIVGNVVGTFIMYNSHNEGIITRENIDTGDSTYANVGGLIGQINSGIIQNSYNTGNVSGGNRTGGIVGRKNPTTTSLLINKCYNDGNISSNYTSSNYSTSVGGLIGYPESGSSGNNGKMIILNSYNKGNLSSIETAGGIVGRLHPYYGYIINSYNTGDVSASIYANGISFVYGNYQYFNNIYNIGNITTASSIYGLFYRNSGTINVTNGYYLTGLSGSNVSGQTGTSLTAEYMSSPEFVNLLNQNKRNINLSTIYSGALSAYSSYELSDWKYDAEKGYPVLDN